jgi:hypothetical protein
MRSKLSCVAAAIVFMAGAASARAADPKKGSGANKKKPAELLTDDKALDKQMQWENNVLGPDDKRAELAKIARAQAITKAAAEKAAAEKAAAEKNPPKETQQETKRTKASAPVLLATPEEEDPGRSTKSKAQSAKDREISPKLDSAEATAPPPPVKPADDKFIDKLLKGEPAGKKKASAKNVDDGALDELLAKEKASTPPAARRSKGKVDGVDSLLRDAEKQPDMPAPKAKTPEWANPDLATPVQAPRPVAVKPQPKKDDGVIHVVQGAAGSSSSSAPVRQVASASPSRRGSVDPFDAPAASPSKRGSAARSAPPASASFSDPFDAPAAPRKKAAAPVAASNSRDPFADDAPAAPPPRKRAAAPVASNSRDPFADDAPAAPPSRPVRAAPAPARVVATPAARPSAAAKREPAGGGASFQDPFDDAPKPKRAAGQKNAAPEGGFKDPFSEGPARPARGGRSSEVAMREPHKADAGKWDDLAGHRAAKEPAASSSGGRSGWGVLKRQSRN